MSGYRYTNVADVRDKVDWEGGIADAIIGYGLTASNLPENAPPEVVEAWLAIEAVVPHVRTISAWFETADDR